MRHLGDLNMLAFRILYRDEYLIAIDKPAGFHSHAPEDASIRISPRWDATRVLERQLGTKAYPVHRLDRATSGILLFSLKRDLCGTLQAAFRGREVGKRYACFVRGTFAGEGLLDFPLKRENGTKAEARTLVRERVRATLPIPGRDGKPRSFTIVDAFPLTGRFHQIRRHLARASAPIVGDSRHGDKKLNRAFSALHGAETLYLRAMELDFRHPVTGQEIALRAGWTKHWHSLFDRLGVCPWDAPRASSFPEPPSLS